MRSFLKVFNIRSPLLNAREDETRRDETGIEKNQKCSLLLSFKITNQ
jgi:hypothetical protein